MLKKFLLLIPLLLGSCQPALADQAISAMTTYSPVLGTDYVPVYRPSAAVGLKNGKAAASSWLLPANNLSDILSASTARTNLGLGTAAVQNSTAFMQSSNNLSDVANAATSINNILPSQASAAGLCLVSNGTNVGFNTCAGSTGGTPPGGTSGQIEFNNAGNFGGFTMSGDCTLVTSTGVITCTKINGNAVTLGGAFTTSGAFALTLTTTAATNVTLPTTGTLVDNNLSNLSTVSHNIYFTTDATYDIGQNITTGRVRNIWGSGTINMQGAATFASMTTGAGTISGGALNIGNITGSGRVSAGTASFFSWTSKSEMFSPSDGQIELTNAAATSFSILQFGGTTSSFPAIKVSSTGLEASLADSSNDTYIKATGIISAGTKFTTTGCSVSSTTGGAVAGTYTSGTTGTCSVVITMNGATGLTAPNGWHCSASDRSTVADIITNTASTTTTATLAGTTTTGDVISFSCTGY